MKRKSYSKEFKVSAVKMILEENMSVSQVSRDLGVNENSLDNWKKQYLEDQENIFPGKGRQSPEAERIKQLEKENRELRMERDILKKATAFFAKENQSKEQR